MIWISSHFFGGLEVDFGQPHEDVLPVVLQSTFDSYQIVVNYKDRNVLFDQPTIEILRILFLYFFFVDRLLYIPGELCHLPESLIL